MGADIDGLTMCTLMLASQVNPNPTVGCDTLPVWHVFRALRVTAQGRAETLTDEMRVNQRVVPSS